ncbi:MAG: L-lactate dehydrogenase complex protein LldE [Paracoccaceae bacterium]|jgi:L-lactate dehydrogenase complex protein LldE
MTATTRVGLFATCLVDLYRPSVGFAAASLLQKAGCDVDVPAAQVCCGQPAYNAGDRANAAAIARQTIDLFEEFDYVVAPSGSCAGMLRHHYPELLSSDAEYAARAQSVADKTWELVAFLTDVRGWTDIDASWPASVTYHDACSGLRELGIRDQPRRLLEKVEGLELRELEATDVCCGFGGTFCIKYPEVSGAIVDNKVDDIVGTGAATVLSGDLGCLMNIAGRLSRRGENVEARHIAEVLSGSATGPAIGNAEDGQG